MLWSHNLKHGLRRSNAFPTLKKICIQFIIVVMAVLGERNTFSPLLPVSHARSGNCGEGKCLFHM